MKRLISDAKAGLQGSPANAGGMDSLLGAWCVTTTTFRPPMSKSLIFQPSPRLHVQPPRIGGLQSAISRQRSNPTVIIHAGLGHDFGDDRISVQGEVCPYRCPQ